MHSKHVSIHSPQYSTENLKQFLPYQERGSRNGKGLLVEICTTKEQQDVCSVLSLVKLQQLGKLPQLIQVCWKLQPAETAKIKVTYVDQNVTLKYLIDICIYTYTHTHLNVRNYPPQVILSQAKTVIATDSYS